MNRTKLALVAVSLAGLALLVSAATASAGKPKPAPKPTGRTVVLVDQSFKACDYAQPLDLDLVKVTITKSAPEKVKDAIYFSLGNCEVSGRIARIEIEQWKGDGVKVGQIARDLLIESGSIRCLDRLPAKHQDAIQVAGGTRVTFRNVVVDCPSANHSAFFVQAGNAQDVVCDGCVLKGGGTTVHVAAGAVRSGVRNSTICGGRSFTFRKSSDGVAADPSTIDAGNTYIDCGFGLRR